jgi:hypothetical protein
MGFIKIGPMWGYGFIENKGMHEVLVHTCPILVKRAIKDFIECKNLFIYFLVISSVYHQKKWKKLGMF